MEPNKEKFSNIRFNIKFNLSNSKNEDKKENNFKSNLKINKKISKKRQNNELDNNEFNEKESEEKNNEEDIFKIKIPKLENNNYSKIYKNYELLERDKDCYNKINNLENKGILKGKENLNEKEYFEKNYYFTQEELNNFEENLENIFTTGIKIGKKYQMNLNNHNYNNNKKINLKNYKIDPDKIFKSHNFIKNLNEYKKLIHQNYSFWLTDSEIYNFYSHFKNFNFFKQVLLTQNEILYSYISYLKNKKLEYKGVKQIIF